MYRRARGTYPNEVVVRLNAKRMKGNGEGRTEDVVRTRRTRRGGEACLKLPCGLVSCRVIDRYPYPVGIQSSSSGFQFVAAWQSANEQRKRH